MTAACARSFAVDETKHGKSMVEEVKNEGFKLSADSRYAYQYLKQWDKSLPVLAYIVLHPGVAEGPFDSTITHCILQARHLHFGGIAIGYLFPARVVDANYLVQYEDPIGDRGKADGSVMDLFDCATTVVAAWGNHPFAPDRAEDVLSLIRRCGLRNSLFYCGFNKDGTPKSPAQASISAKPKRWRL